MCLSLVAAAAWAPASDGAGGPCGTTRTKPATYAHVIWIFLENHRYSSIIGSRHAPYINGTLVPRCGLATNYHAISHPSLPNYIAAVSGASQLPVACGNPAKCPQSGPTVFDQVPSWRVYAEDMPAPCYPTDTDLYPADHNAPVYYPALAGPCKTRDVPFGTATSGAFAGDLASNTLPALSIVVPNTCNSMENCTVATGDAWLQNWIPRITASAAYKAGGTAIFVTWDEGAGGTKGEICSANPTDESCHVATIVVSPTTKPGKTDGTGSTHYSLLRTTEELLGIGTYLGQAASAASMRSAFGL